MNKKDFFKEVNKKYKEVKIFYVFTIIYSLLLIGVLIFNQFCIRKEIVSLDTYLVINILIIILSIVGVVIDLKHKGYLNKMFKSYQVDGNIPEYKYNATLIKVIVFGFALFFAGFLGFVLSDYKPTTKVRPTEIEGSVLTMTTKDGKIIETEYMDFGAFSIKVPKDFKLMSDDDRKLKYPTEERPTVVYTNEDGSINIAYSNQGHELADEDVSLMINTMEQLYGKAFDVLGSEVIEVDGHNVGFIKFISPALDSNIYNHFMVISVNGKSVIMSFNCIEKYMSEWTEVGEFILKSIVFE